MRHKYDTRAISLGRTPVGEATALVTLLTEEVGLVRARAQSLRRPGAKLAAALATLAESSVALVRGKEGWRLAGAVLEESWFARLPDADARERVSRVSGLLLRLAPGEAHDLGLFPVMRGFLTALASAPIELRDAAEALAVIRILSVLGLDAGNVSGTSDDFSPTLLIAVGEERPDYVARINRGIAASGL